MLHDSFFMHSVVSIKHIRLENLSALPSNVVREEVI